MLVLEEIDHPAAGTELEVVERSDQIVVQPPSREGEFHLHPLGAGVGPDVSGVSTRRAPCRGMLIDDRRAYPLLGKEIRRRRTNDPAADYEHLGPRLHPAHPFRPRPSNVAPLSYI